MRNAVSGLGLAPDAAMVTFPIALFLPGSDIGPVEARRQEFYDGLTRWRSSLSVGGGGESPLITVEAATYEDALVKANHLMLAKHHRAGGFRLVSSRSSGDPGARVRGNMREIDTGAGGLNPVPIAGPSGS
jgi:hypothetical protein